MSQLIQALKEWQIAVEALEQAQLIMLLRKGGLREEGGKFTVPADRVLLYPTYEHQQPQWLKPDYANRVQPVESGWHPTTVQIGAWAEITEVFQVHDRDRLTALQPFHIWTEPFVFERLKWKPSQPVSVLLLRTYRLPQLQQIDYSAAYGGCKSWIDLAQPISLAGSVPVLTEPAYAEQVAAIRTVVAAG